MTKQIQNRTKQNQDLMVEQLKKIPIIQVVCEKLGIARSTYYRWRIDNPKFAQQADLALREGIGLINDLAEGQLISAIRDQNLTAVMYWLNHRHASYTNKLEVTTKTSYQLDSKQKQLIKKALQHASLLVEKNKE